MWLDDDGYGFNLVQFVESVEDEVAEGGGDGVDALLPGGDVYVEVVGDDFEGDVRLSVVVCDGEERGGLHVEAVGGFLQMLQEISRIDVRGDETIGGEEFAVDGLGCVDGQSVGEHGAVKELSTSGNDLRDPNQASHRNRMCTGCSDI